MVNLAEMKRFFLFNLIGSLIIAALVAIVTVLVGKFNETTARVMWTLFMVVVHSIVSLSFIWDDEKQETFERLAFFTNVLFFIIVLSFITSILGIWKVIPRDVVWRIYETAGVLLFASLHGNILAKALGRETYIDMIIFANYFFMVVVVAMLMPIIYIKDYSVVLGEFYFRALAAVAIADGALSILAIIFYKIYMHGHPKAENALANNWVNEKGKVEKKGGLSIWVWLLIIYLILQIGFSLFFARMF
jgi:hypothetical protein